MIVFAGPLSAGNAVRLYLRIPPEAAAWRVLRKAAAGAEFSGPDDPAAVRCEEPTAKSGFSPAWTDTDGLSNGQPYTYRPFWSATLTGPWVSGGEDVTLTPAATFIADGPDPQDVLIERVDLGLQSELARGTLALTGGRTRIDVLRAYAVFSEGTLPVVTVELTSTETTGRALGEVWGDDEDQGDAWQEFEGWKRQWTLALVAWSLNADERIALRQALERILLANLPVFDALGMYNIDCHWQDVFDDLQYDAPIYTSIGTVTCTALSRVGVAVPKITDVEVIRACEREP